MEVDSLCSCVTIGRGWEGADGQCGSVTVVSQPGAAVGGRGSVGSLDNCVATSSGGAGAQEQAGQGGMCLRVGRGRWKDMYEGALLAQQATHARAR